jgi:glutaminyl-tRNA synthetase
MDKTQENNIKKTTNFIRDIIDEDLYTNKYNGKVHTRFPPEPNGYSS